MLKEQLQELQAALLASILDMEEYRKGYSSPSSGPTSPLEWTDGLLLLHTCPPPLDQHLLGLLGCSTVRLLFLPSFLLSFLLSFLPSSHLSFFSSYPIPRFFPSPFLPSLISSFSNSFFPSFLISPSPYLLLSSSFPLSAHSPAVIFNPLSSLL